MIDYSHRNVARLAEVQIHAWTMNFGIVQAYREEALAWYAANSSKAPSYVVFYGNISERRSIYLKALQSAGLPIAAFNELSGVTLRRTLLEHAAVIVNIHYYQDCSLLEQVRLYECLSLGLRVVSEDAINMEEVSPALYQAVDFVPTGDIQVRCSDGRVISMAALAHLRGLLLPCRR